MGDLGRELFGLVAQAIVFLVGLALALTGGVHLGAGTMGPGSLLIVTLIAGSGLLGAAVVSQLVRDRIVYGRV